MEKLKFKKGMIISEDIIRDIVGLLPIGIRKSKESNRWDYKTRHMKDDLEDEEFFKYDCEITIKIKQTTPKA